MWRACSYFDCPLPAHACLCCAVPRLRDLALETEHLYFMRDWKDSTLANSLVLSGLTQLTQLELKLRGRTDAIADLPTSLVKLNLDEFYAMGIDFARLTALRELSLVGHVNPPPGLQAIYHQIECTPPFFD